VDRTTAMWRGAGVSVKSAGREAGATRAVAGGVCENMQGASRELERPSSPISLSESSS
jgi:hypothetical protein